MSQAVTDFAHAIGLLIRRARAAGASAENPDDLSWSETAVLKRLAQEGPTTTADLARAQGMRPQSMRTIVASLERLRMIARKPHPTDGRQVILALTAKGAAAHKISGDAKKNWIVQAIAKLPPQDRETLFEAGRIITRLVESDPQ